MEKITKRSMYVALVNFAKTGEMSFETEDGVVVVSAEQLAAFAANEIGLIDKKNAKAKETAAKKKTEDPLLDVVYDCVSDEFETSAEIAARIIEGGEYDEETASVSKVVYRLNALVKEGKVEKTDVKRDKRTVKGFKRVG